MVELKLWIIAGSLTNKKKNLMKLWNSKNKFYWDKIKPSNFFYFYTLIFLYFTSLLYVLFLHSVVLNPFGRIAKQCYFKLYGNDFHQNNINKCYFAILLFCMLRKQVFRKKKNAFCQYQENFAIRVHLNWCILSASKYSWKYFS